MARGKVNDMKKRMPVIQRYVDGKFVSRHESVTKAALSVNGAESAISAVCKGKRRLAYGYRWEYEGEGKDCKHEFVYDEQIGEAVCRKCGYVVTKEDKQAALEYSMAMLEAEEADSKDLKPCPFCGGKVKLHIDYIEGMCIRSIECQKCYAFVGMYGDTTEAVVEAWNRRVKEEV